MTQKFIRRNRVDERLALGIAAIGGAVAAFAGAEPTGSTVVDVVLVVIAAGAVVWASASAQWWALAAAAGVGAIIAWHPVVAAVGGLAFLGGLNVGTWRREQTVVRAVLGAVVVNVLIRSELGGFLGLSALLGIGCAVALFVLGVVRRPSRVRRRTWLGLAGVGGAVVVATLAVGVSGASARPDVSNGATTARRAITTLNNGNYQRAAELFADASVRFERADGSLGGALSMPGRLVPVLAQNVRASSDLSAAAAQATEEAAFALRQIDPATLRMSGGRLDLEAVAAVQAPLERVEVALDGLSAVVEDVDSPWLFGPVREELDDLEDDVAENEPRLRNAIDAVRLAPQLLGQGEARRYLVLFTTPAETRGLGGFVGNIAVLEVADGALSVTQFARAEALNTLLDGTTCAECSPELLQAYGPYGFTAGVDGTVSNRLLSNITMPAHFPYIAEAVVELYPQATGQSIDGVVVMDPYVIQALMQYTGPIEVPELNTVVRPRNAAAFIIEDQYVLAERKGVRVEALDSLASGAIDALLRADLPEPPTVARDLGPLIAERRLLMWTVWPDERLLLDRVGLLGSIPTLDPIDGGFSVAVTNGAANKVDAFLDRTVDVDVVERAEGRFLVADVTLQNNAPASGLPNYVIGNAVGLPDGTSRLRVTFYGPPTLTSATLDGEEFPTGALPEAGWTAYSNFVNLAPGQQRVFHLEFSLPPRPDDSDGPPAPTLWSQPLARRP